MPAVVSSHHQDTMQSPPSPTTTPDGCRHTHTCLTYSRHHLIDTAMETIKTAENGQYVNSKGQTVHLKDDLDYAVEHSAHYDDEFDFYEALKRYDNEGSTASGSGSSGRGLSSLRSLDEDEKKSDENTTTKNTHSNSNNSLTSSFNSGTSSMIASALQQSLHSSGSALKLNNILATKGPGDSPQRQRFPRTSFLVVSASWLESASELLGACVNSNIKVGVLNSASGTTPGGRFLKGTVSQEDCLCRASLLYSCISQPKFQSEGRFYGKNRSLRYGTSNCVIFSPDVPVIRKDSVEGTLLDKYEKVSFVTIPAPNAFTTSSYTGKEYNDIESDQREKGLDSRSRNLSINDFQQLEKDAAHLEAADFDEKFDQKRKALLSSLSDRIHRALAAFVLGGCTDLVLPAFGCGVHGNDPTMVASVFREMLSDPDQFGGRFRTVVFAVPPSRKQNYQAFSAYFQKKDAVKCAALSRGVTMD